ncbi:MAG: hypothetical protein KGJ44_01635 [Betaproteobacteria bacterium]|nr:hypothetical protein [Betaproteobacteria bacterium]MDE2047084.1 hypothetical protein [Betaproteobacteria bacterium]
MHFLHTRGEVRSLSAPTLRQVLIEWMWESPSELIPTYARIGQVVVELAARPDADELAGLIDTCRQYMEE